MSASEFPVGVRGFYDKFVDEGAVGVNTDIVASLQAGYNQDHGLLVVHSDVVRDGELQPMTGGQYYHRVAASGISVVTLGRRFNEGPDLTPFSDIELSAADQHARHGHVITSLEEHPLRLINQLDTDTPPLVVFLHRARPEGSGALVDLRQAVDVGRIAMCVTDSEAARNAYEAVGVPGSLLQVIPNGIDLSRFTPSQEKRDTVRGELQIPADAPTVLYVSRFSDEKDVPLFVKSALRYLEDQPDGHVIMAGAGLSDQNFELLALVGNHAVDSPSEILTRFHALGIRRDIDALHASADVLALTSRSESYPLCLLEAMATGVIPTSTDVGDARAMLEGRGIITSRDPAEIAAAWQEAYARRGELAIPDAERQALGKPRMLQAYNALIRSVVRSAAA